MTAGVSVDFLGGLQQSFPAKGNGKVSNNVNGNTAERLIELDFG